MSFNSILVRLKAKPNKAVGTFVRRFQFHTGSIKRVAGVRIMTISPIVFQFHTGSIKSQWHPIRAA